MEGLKKRKQILEGVSCIKELRKKLDLLQILQAL